MGDERIKLLEALGEVSSMLRHSSAPAAEVTVRIVELERALKHLTHRVGALESTQLDDAPLDEDLAGVEDRLDDLENRVLELETSEPGFEPMDEDLTGVEDRLDDLEARLGDLEARFEQLSQGLAPLADALEAFLDAGV